MHKALRGRSREIAMPDAQLLAPVTGRIIDRGLSDELHDRAYAVLDGVDGRVHNVKLPGGVALESLPLNAIASTCQQMAQGFGGELRIAMRQRAEFLASGPSGPDQRPDGRRPRRTGAAAGA
jgi:hypothetical protein